MDFKPGPGSGTQHLVAYVTKAAYKESKGAQHVVQRFHAAYYQHL